MSRLFCPRSGRLTGNWCRVIIEKFWKLQQRRTHRTARHSTERIFHKKLYANSMYACDLAGFKELLLFSSIQLIYLERSSRHSSILRLLGNVNYRIISQSFCCFRTFVPNLWHDIPWPLISLVVLWAQPGLNGLLYIYQYMFQLHSRLVAFCVWS